MGDQRPTEISQWRKEYCRQGIRKLDAWIAIDDRNLLQEQHGAEMWGHFVKTNPKVGLDHVAMHKCIQLLQAQGLQPAPDDSTNAFKSNLTKCELASTPTHYTDSPRANKVEDSPCATACRLPAVPWFQRPDSILISL